MLNFRDSLNNDFEAFIKNKHHHITSSDSYIKLDTLIKEYIVSISDDKYINFDLLGLNLKIKNVNFGAVQTKDLFCLFELILFEFYRRNLKNKNVADIGANIGLHSILMNINSAKNIDSFEPDFDLNKKTFTENISNNCEKKNNIILINKAVSDFDGSANFTRTLGNTTSSHLTTEKKGAYGKLENFDVEVINFANICDKYDFAKIDAEGSEIKILNSIKESSWDKFSCFVEITSFKKEKHLENLFNKLSKINVRFFVQSLGWEPAKTFDQLPKTWKDGNCYISKKTFDL